MLSPATWRNAASSASLVAMSRLFIASGRFKVTVATPSTTFSSTGEASDMGAGFHTGAGPGSGQPDTAAHEPVGGGLEASGFAREQLGGRTARPVGGQQLGGETRVVEEELAPLVDQAEPGSERRLVLAPALWARGIVAHQALGHARPRGVRRGQAGQVPGGDRVGVELDRDRV